MLFLNGAGEWAAGINGAGCVQDEEGEEDADAGEAGELGDDCSEAIVLPCCCCCCCCCAAVSECFRLFRFACCACPCVVLKDGVEVKEEQNRDMPLHSFFISHVSLH